MIVVGDTIIDQYSACEALGMSAEAPVVVVKELENKNFLNGTMSIAEFISNNTLKKSLISVLGGGDTLAAINKSENKLSFSHLSTAGGAFLEYLEGKDLPGLSVLK